MTEIKVNLVDSKNVSILYGSPIKIQLFDKYLFYTSECGYENWKDNDDHSLGKSQRLAKECMYLQRDSIYQISVAYDNDEDVNYVSLLSGNNNVFFNVSDYNEGIRVINEISQWRFSE